MHTLASGDDILDASDKRAALGSTDELNHQLDGAGVGVLQNCAVSCMLQFSTALDPAAELRVS